MLDWMAWTWPTAAFFAIIFGLLALMTVLAVKYPETERVGILGIATTRGDRLFITLLGSAFINLAWLGLTDASQWWGLAICGLWAAAIFRFA
jgi:predicted small integral membrane protein